MDGEESVVFWERAGLLPSVKNAGTTQEKWCGGGIGGRALLFRGNSSRGLWEATRGGGRLGGKREVVKLGSGVHNCGGNVSGVGKKTREALELGFLCPEVSLWWGGGTQEKGCGERDAVLFFFRTVRRVDTRRVRKEENDLN